MTDQGKPGPWKDSFKIDGVAGGPVKLSQIQAKSFILESDIRYDGETGLEGRIDGDTLEDIRKLPKGIDTDLASVPGPLRWFLGTYGRHTPAVLIHDRLIPTPDELSGKMTDQYADRYLRFMAKDVGVRFFKRWILWAGVAVRTRWKNGWVRRISLILWFIAAALGMYTFTRPGRVPDLSAARVRLGIGVEGVRQARDPRHRLLRRRRLLNCMHFGCSD
jgi:hypothetical protein